MLCLRIASGCTLRSSGSLFLRLQYIISREEKSKPRKRNWICVILSAPRKPFSESCLNVFWGLLLLSHWKKNSSKIGFNYNLTHHCNQHRNNDQCMIETPVAPIVADERQNGWEFKDRQNCTGRLCEVIQRGEVHDFTLGR